MTEIMTPKEFKEKAQEIFDKHEGWAGDDGHQNIDRLMQERLRSLGYGEGIDILFSMDSIWYC